MSTREQLEAEAEGLFPTDDTTYISIHMDDLNSDLQRAFIKGRTVSAEQWGLAAGRVQDNWNLCGDDAGCHCEDATEFAWEVARDAFRAAGFLIEGDDQ